MAKEHAGAGNKAPESAPSTENAEAREAAGAEDDVRKIAESATAGEKAESETPESAPSTKNARTREVIDAENEAPKEQAMVSHIAPVILLN